MRDIGLRSSFLYVCVRSSVFTWKKVEAAEGPRLSTTVRVTAPVVELNAGTPTTCEPPSKAKPKKRANEAQLLEALTCRVHTSPARHFGLALALAS